MKVYVVDLDGTVALHRCPSDADHLSRSYILRNRARAIRGHHDYDHVLYDLPNVPVIDLVTQLPERLMFATGRPEKCRVDSFRWLWWHLGRHIFDFRADREFLRMRKDGDHRGDDVVKQEIRDSIIADGYEICGVFDDRQRVVDMWRRNGHTVFQVAPGDF